jgi:hypothetical protein
MPRSLATPPISGVSPRPAASSVATASRRTLFRLGQVRAIAVQPSEAGQRLRLPGWIRGLRVPHLEGPQQQWFRLLVQTEGPADVPQRLEQSGLDGRLVLEVVDPLDAPIQQLAQGLFGARSDPPGRRP